MKYNVYRINVRHSSLLIRLLIYVETVAECRSYINYAPLSGVLSFSIPFINHVNNLATTKPALTPYICLNILKSLYLLEHNNT
jgi:hypothetical protein